MRTFWSVTGMVALIGCSEGEPAVPVPGLLEPSCTMTWAAYEVTAVELPADHVDAMALGLDIDQQRGDSNGGIDNQIGSLMASVAGLFPETWDPQAAANAHLAAGEVHWVIEVGTCADGDEVRVVSARATDVDGDGVLEVGDRGVASVGRRGEETVRGLGWVPIGTLVGASPTAATDAWLPGLSLTTALTITDERVDGLLAIGLDPFTDATVTPVMNFFNERLAAGTSPGARSLDANADGVIDLEEMRANVRAQLALDLDLGACDDLACYAPFDPDGISDHASLGLGLEAVRVELE